MKKILVGLVAAVFTVAGVAPTQAAEFKTVAIIDSGFNAELFGDSVIEEVCIVAASIGCNNRSGLDVGPGAASSPVQLRSFQMNDWNHGNQMAEVAIAANPDVKVLLIRNSKIFGKRMYLGTENDFAAALEWVDDNASTYNVVAVSFSRGSHSYASSGSTTRLKSLIRLYTSMHDRLVRLNRSQSLINYYANKIAGFQAQLDAAGPVPCKYNQATEDAIVSLKTNNIATFIATGNDGDKVNIDTPACIEDAISVATLAKYGNDDGTYNLALNTNASSTTDFASSGNFNTAFGVVRDSSSVATAVLAAHWVATFDGSYDSTYAVIAGSAGIVNGYSILAVDVLK